MNLDICVVVKYVNLLSCYRSTTRRQSRNAGRAPDGRGRRTRRRRRLVKSQANLINIIVLLLI